MSTKTASGGQKKHGRDATKCQRYRAAGTREKNKAGRIAKEKRRQARFKAKKRIREDK